MEAFEIIRNTMNEFDKVPDDKVRIFISLVESLISRKKFGKMYEQALAYMAAHKMKLSGLGSTTLGGIRTDNVWNAVSPDKEAVYIDCCNGRRCESWQPE